MDAGADKAEVRTRIRQQRRERESAPEHGTSIAGHIMDLEPIRQACENGLPIACYASRSGEPPTQDVRRALRDAGAEVVLPRVEGSALVWCIDDDNTQWETSSMGIQEPVGAPVEVQPAAWIIPALAIDEDGYRLGQGGGFYDRTLHGLPHDGRGPIIALIFEEELMHEVPREEHDSRVDIVVTPERVRWLAMPD